MNTQRSIRWYIYGLVLLAFTSQRLQADTPLVDPGIPDGEYSVYRITTGEKTFFVTESAVVYEENGREIYEINITSDSEETVARIYKESMLPFFARTVTTKKTHKTETSTQVVFETRVETADILFLGMTDLKYALRGFPFQSADYLSIKPVDALEGEDTPFSMKVKRVKEETLEVAGRQVACYKLQLRVAMSGIFSVLNGLIPRSYFWYSTAEPHYLVAYEISGASPGESAGGRSKSRAELSEYSGW